MRVAAGAEGGEIEREKRERACAREREGEREHEVVVTYVSTTALIAEPYSLASRSSSAASKSYCLNLRVPSSLKCFTPAGMRIAPPAAAPPPEAMARSLRGLGKIPSAWIGLWIRVRPSHTQELGG